MGWGRELHRQVGDIEDLGCVQTSSHFRPPDWAAEGDAPPAPPPPAAAPSFQPPPSRTGRVPAMRTEPADAEVAKLQERVAQLAAESRQRQQEKRRRGDFASKRIPKGSKNACHKVVRLVSRSRMSFDVDGLRPCIGP